MDEFQFLAAQAQTIGVSSVPSVERLTHTLPDGRTVSALRYGDDTPRVTFLHGAGLNAHTWDTTILALGLPALAVDLPGHGDSSWRDDAAYTGRVLAADVAAPIAGWTTGPQLLVGHSLGGLTAAALAAAHPDLVRELVVIDITPGLDPNGGAQQIRRFFAGPRDWATRDELVDRAVAFGLGGSREAAARGVFLNSRVRADGRVEWKHHFAHLDAPVATRAVSGWDDLADVVAPITLLRGERGYLSVADEEEYRQRLPQASIRVVPAGHNVHEELPAQLGGFLADLVELAEIDPHVTPDVPRDRL